MPCISSSLFTPLSYLVLPSITFPPEEHTLTVIKKKKCLHSIFVVVTTIVNVFICVELNYIQPIFLLYII